MPLRTFTAIILIALAATAAGAQQADEIVFAREFLGRLQVRSIVDDREYCGYFGRAEDGTILATRPRRGKYNTCVIDYLPPLLSVFASYHTHAAYDALSFNEIPSPQDLQSDIESGVDGFVATPGGRLWYTDHRERETRQLCGEGCLPQDPNYRPGKFRKVRLRYSQAELEKLMEE